MAKHVLGVLAVFSILFFQNQIWADEPKDFGEFLKEKGKAETAEPSSETVVPSAVSAEPESFTEFIRRRGTVQAPVSTRRPLKIFGYPYYFGEPEEREIAGAAVQEPRFGDYYIQLAIGGGCVWNDESGRDTWQEIESYVRLGFDWLKLDAKYTFTTSDGRWEDPDTGASGSWNEDEQVWSIGPNIRFLDSLDLNVLFKIHTSGTYWENDGSRDGGAREYLVLEERVSWWPKLFGFVTNLEYTTNYNCRPGAYVTWMRGRVKVNLLEVKADGKFGLCYSKYNDFSFGKWLPFTSRRQDGSVKVPWLVVRGGGEVEAYGGGSVPSWHRQGAAFLEFHSPKLGGCTVAGRVGGGDSGLYGGIEIWVPVLEW